MSSEADDARAESAQAAGETHAEGQEPNENPQQAQGAEDDAARSQEDADERVPKSELQKKNREAQNLRRERNELQRRLDAYETEKLTEQEKLEKRAQDAENAVGERDAVIEELQTRLRRATFIETIGLPNPRLAWAALNDLAVKAEFDDDGNLANKRQLVKALKDEFPREFGNGSADGGERAEPTVAQDMNSALRALRGGARR